MPIATLRFALPDERHDHLCAVHGPRLYGALRDLDEDLRVLLKHDGINCYTAKRLAEELRGMIAEDLALVEE